MSSDPPVCSDQESGALMSCSLGLKPQHGLGGGGSDHSGSRAHAHDCTQLPLDSPAPREPTPLGDSAQTLDIHGSRVSRQTGAEAGQAPAGREATFLWVTKTHMAHGGHKLTHETPRPALTLAQAGRREGAPQLRTGPFLSLRHPRHPRETSALLNQPAGSHAVTASPASDSMWW